MNLIDSLINWLEEEFKKTDSDVKFYIDDIPSPDIEGVVLRHDPSQAKERNFVDGSSLQLNSIGIYSRFSGKEESRVILKKISNALDNLQIDDDSTTYAFDVATQISYAYTDDKGRAIYTFNVSCASTQK